MWILSRPDIGLTPTNSSWHSYPITFPDLRHVMEWKTLRKNMKALRNSLRNIITGTRKVQVCVCGRTPHSQCPQLPWTNLQMFGSDVTLNRPDLIYAYLLLFLLQVPVLSQMNDGAACGLTSATCIFSKQILVKFLCSQAGKKRALWMTDAARWWLTGGLCMLLIFLSQKNTIRGCFIKLSVQLFT